MASTHQQSSTAHQDTSHEHKDSTAHKDSPEHKEASPAPLATVAVPQISITPVLGVNLARVYSTVAPTPNTGPGFPIESVEFGMQPGKIVQGSDGVRYMLGENPTGGTALAAAAAANLDSANGFKVTASAPSATVFAAAAVNAMPVSSRGWFKLTAPIP